MAETLRAPRGGGGGGACLFLKSGVRAGGWSLGGDRRRRPAAEKGQPMRELGPERVSGAARPAAEACTRLGAEPALAAAAAKGPRAAREQRRLLGARAAGLQARPGAGARGGGNFCGPGGGGSARLFVRLPPRRAPLRGPHPPGPQRRVQRRPAVFVQLRSSRAAPAHPGAAPAGKPSQAAGPTVAAAAASGIRLLLCLSETWCPTGLACVT